MVIWFGLGCLIAGMVLGYLIRYMTEPVIEEPTVIDDEGWSITFGEWTQVEDEETFIPYSTERDALRRELLYGDQDKEAFGE